MSRESSRRTTVPIRKIEWEGVRGNALIANLQFGYSRQDGTSPFLNDPQIVGRSDLDTERVTGDNVVSGETSCAGVYHSTGSVSWYKPNWGRGNHEFKTGFDYGYGSTEVRGADGEGLQLSSAVRERGARFEWASSTPRSRPGATCACLAAT